jgi:hypothetical protein
MIASEVSPNVLAREAAAGRRVLGTTLRARELTALGADVRRLAVFSAQQANLEFVQEIADTLDELMLGPTAERETLRAAGEAPLQLSGPEATRRLMKLADELELKPRDPDQEGTIQDVRTFGRADLIVRTQQDIAAGFGRYVAENDESVLDAYPARELIRVTSPADPKRERNWKARWAAAGGRLYDGRMIAAKDSEVWQRLGDGAGGYGDALGNPFPPFAFNSGMDVEEVGREEAVALGVIQPRQTVRPDSLTLADHAGLKTGRFDRALLATMADNPDLAFDGDTLTLA